jgi:pilus assembly protein TadC
VVKIKKSETTEEFINKLFPKLEEKLKLAQREPNIVVFVRHCFFFALLFSFNISLIFFFIFLKYKIVFFVIPVFILLFLVLFIISFKILDVNINKVKMEIESDIFVPSRMLLTLLEAGNSIVTALVGVSYTKAKSSKYFGKIASEIFLGKTIEEAIEDAIKYTPSESFKRVLEPIKKSLRTGADIQKSLSATLEDLSREKIIEIEEYEKKLSPVSMFYMIFGTIVPALSIVGLVLIISVIGLEVRFFPFLFMFLFLILIIQIFFISIFKELRPMVKI